MFDTTTHIGVLSVELHIPASQSLKDKRRVLKSLKDRVRSRFNVSISEVGELEKWQRSVLGVCMINRDKKHIMGHFEAVLSLIQNVDEVLVSKYQMTFL